MPWLRARPIAETDLAERPGGRRLVGGNGGLGLGIAIAQLRVRIRRRLASVRDRQEFRVALADVADRTQRVTEADDPLGGAGALANLQVGQARVRPYAPKKDVRVICDHVAGMTDDFLLKTYDRLFSPRMGSVFDKL
jgi:hypothetical protein